MTVTEPAPWIHPGVGTTARDEGTAPAIAADHLRDDLLAEIAKPVSLKDITLPVRSHPGWEVVYSPALDADLAKRWAKVQSEDDAIFDFALRVLAGQCRGFIRNGAPVLIDGERITFASAFMHEATGALDTVAALRAFYSDDGAISDHFEKLQLAGREGLDPTGGSSAS